MEFKKMDHMKTCKSNDVSRYASSKLQSESKFENWKWITGQNVCLWLIWSVCVWWVEFVKYDLELQGSGGIHAICLWLKLGLSWETAEYFFSTSGKRYNYVSLREVKSAFLFLIIQTVIKSGEYQRQRKDKLVSFLEFNRTPNGCIVPRVAYFQAI